jgi:sporulation protein YlmC with PRC-barrel domain
MLKHIVLATFLTCGATAAYAQTQQATSPPPSSTAAPAATMAPADARKLIGRNVKNAENETIGEIKSIFIGKDGKVDSVMVSVGGFLGVGNREVRIAWSDLRISDNGDKVMVNMTRDQLKAKPEYRYSNESWRGQVFTDTGPWTARPSDTARPSERMTASNHASRSDQAATNSTSDFNALGDMSANTIIGATVRNENHDSVGRVVDIYVDDRGAIKTAVVSVGGFLGVGSKDVAVKWNELKFSRDGESLVITTNWTKESLKAMPDYKYERRQRASSGG